MASLPILKLIFCTKKFSTTKFKNYDCRFDNTQIIDNSSSSYKFNSSIQEIERADAILLIGSNPRWEAAVLNAKLERHISKIITKLVL